MDNLNDCAARNAPSSVMMIKTRTTKTVSPTRAFDCLASRGQIVRESEKVPASAAYQLTTDAQLNPPAFTVRNPHSGDVDMKPAGLRSDVTERVASRDGMEGMPHLTAGVFGLDRPLSSPSLHMYAQRAAALQSSDYVELNGGETHRTVTIAKSLANVEMSVNDRDREQTRERLQPASERVEHQRATYGCVARLVGGWERGKGTYNT